MPPGRFNNKFIENALNAQCRSFATYEALFEKAIRKDGVYQNGGHSNLLFPRTCIDAVLLKEENEEAAEKEENDKGNEILRVLKCECTLCTAQGSDLQYVEKLASQIAQDWDQRRAFAILTYMGATFAARTFFRHQFGTNSFNLENAIQKLPASSTTNTPDFLKGFSKVFENTKMLFEPVSFRKGDVWRSFTDEENLPFLFDKPLKKSPQSPSRNMYGFWLHAEFCKNLPAIDIPEDQFIEDPDTKFAETRLARKELTVDEQAFKAESSVLEFIAREYHPHLIKLLFAYQRGEKFNLVFPFYPANLQQVLEDGWFPESQPAVPERFKSSKLRHWLWEQILKVIEGLGCVHTPTSAPGIFPGVQDVMGGHFDIKPANILIDHNGQLVLTDFGLAQIKSKSQSSVSTFTGPPGTLSHQPPPVWGDNGDAQYHWHRYDVWSMACVMLDIIHFVLRGSGGVKQFITEREKEEPANTKSSVFWKRGTRGFVLKRCVQKSLTDLKAGNDRYLTMVANLLQQMFSIDPQARLTIAQCAKRLSMDHLTDQWPRKDEDECSIGGDHTKLPLEKL
jgi:serine/threonine protein kinase